MYLKKYFIVLVLLFFSASVFAQSSGSANALVKISLKKGLKIENLTGDLTFPETVVTGSAQNPSSSNIVNFLVTGHKSSNVIVGFSSTLTLTSGTDNLVFTPAVEKTGESTTYASGDPVSAGSGNSLGANGLLNLWLSGSIAVPANAPAGDYSGTFQMTVTY